MDDYFKEMEVAIIGANVEENCEATMARFLNDLNRDIQDHVEMYHYVEMEDLVHRAIKIEQQLKKGSNSKMSSWKSNAYKREEKSTPSSKASNPQPKKATLSKGKESTTSSNRNSDIKCFKCQGRGHYARQFPNKLAMIIREDGEFETDNEDMKSNQSLEDSGEEEEAVNGDLLVTKRTLNAQIKEDSEMQRENIFHTRCFVQGKVCNMIIDGGSSVNVTSTLMVEKLSLPTTKHPKPYKLQWLNDSALLQKLPKRPVEKGKEISM